MTNQGGVQVKDEEEENGEKRDVKIRHEKAKDALKVNISIMTVNTPEWCNFVSLNSLCSSTEGEATGRSVKKKSGDWLKGSLQGNMCAPPCPRVFLTRLHLACFKQL